MEEKNDDVQPPPAGKVVGIIFNCKRGTNQALPDAEAEYDSMDTVYAIRDVFADAGLQTVLLECDETLPQALQNTHIDIAFNIAEGRSGRGREAEAPALLNLLGIPFTGSDETALCIALDKALCKKLLSAYHIRTPRFRVISSDKDVRLGGLRVPVIVKPNAEGSSKGIPDACVASSEAEFKELVRRELRLYGGPVLAEEYIPGREFTVGLLGNGETLRVFPPMEIVFRGNTNGDYQVYSYGVKQAYTKYVRYECPARLDSKTEEKMIRTARRVYRALGCCDFARVDFRLTEDGTLYFIEINPLPGLAPGYSDYPMLAEFAGVSYRELVLSVLRAGMRRYGLETVQ
ncbi:MAG: ATP-grasp domain-containing protein [Clostridiales bacterium]|nr:ATP-grasp domain-containing protein [Clostridiales bacterium]